LAINKGVVLLVSRAAAIAHIYIFIRGAIIWLLSLILRRAKINK